MTGGLCLQSLLDIFSLFIYAAHNTKAQQDSIGNVQDFCSISIRNQITGQEC